jgi:hypothetical protein
LGVDRGLKIEMMAFVVFYSFKIPEMEEMKHVGALKLVY